jgi:hypothetical protein
MSPLRLASLVRKTRVIFRQSGPRNKTSIHEESEISRKIGLVIAITNGMTVVVGSKLHFSTKYSVTNHHSNHHTSLRQKPTRTVLIYISPAYTRRRTGTTRPHATAVGFVCSKRLCIPTAEVLRGLKII